VSIPNVEYRAKDYSFCTVNANGSKKSLDQQARVASAVRAASFKAWYRANGVTDNEIYTARVIVRDEAWESYTR
jgi:hypothetical protein